MRTFSLIAPLAAWVAAVTAHARPSGGAGTISNLSNPAISANALMLARHSSLEPEPDGEEEAHAHAEAGFFETPATGLFLQEIEIQLTASVDPYWFGDMVVAAHKEEFEVEEGYVQSQALPAGLQLKAGKFLLPFGRHNRLHTHAFPLIEAPLANAVLLGEEGLNDVGADLSWLTPLPWYLEINAGAYNGGPPLFESGDPEDLAYGGHVKSLIDLSDATTLEAGGSVVLGDDAEGDRRSVWGGDLTLKWLPVGAEWYRALTVQAEWIRTRIEEEGAARDRSGSYLLAQFKIARGWWIQGRYDRLESLDSVERESESPREPDAHAEEPSPDNRWSAAAAWAPTEFSALRLQYDRLTFPEKSERVIGLQLNLTWGAHPAHDY